MVRLNFQRPEGANFRDGRDAEEVGKAVAASGQGQMSPAGRLLSIENDQKMMIRRFSRRIVWWTSWTGREAQSRQRSDPIITDLF